MALMGSHICTRMARRIGRREGPHYEAVEADPEFYRDWLAERLRDALRGDCDLDKSR